MSRSHATATPVSAPAPGAPSTTSAGVVTRVLAAGVDLAAVAGAVLLVDLAAAGIRFAWAPASFSWPRLALWGTAALLVVAVGYLTVAWATTGRTYGARLLGLRVLSARGAPLGWFRSVLRAVACVVFPIGLFWCGISVTRRSLQDVLVGSVVRYDPP
ncbi:RDD family protein [Geodermatophilus aquaeductus]|uniref:RDD family protein n=1 Tax=Geodermatophilus aquaeductus TaxID=1564161 RepID=A0A521E2N4_9ACTN|nr:RDD family protein [Geodermatophilus aquaeductus]SMO77581.1 RDD family protein [Geodermatophilus aquaeductus]